MQELAVTPISTNITHASQDPLLHTTISRTLEEGGPLNHG